MALTKKQAEAFIKLFVNAFVNAKSEDEQKQLYLEFEDNMGRSIKDWETESYKLLSDYPCDEAVVECFRRLWNRKENDTNQAYCVRELRKEDLPQLKDLIKAVFEIYLTSAEDERLCKFIDSGYSFVACNDDEIVGAVLGVAELSDLCWDGVYINTLVVSENLRGLGIGKKLIHRVEEEVAANNMNFIRLQTDRNIEAYKMYKHLGFKEMNLTAMKKYVF